MSEVGNFILGLQPHRCPLQSRRYIPRAVGDKSRRGGQGGELLAQTGARQGRPRPLVPGDLQQCAGLAGRPETVGDHRHPGRHRHHRPHAGDAVGLVGIEAAQGGAENRRSGDDRHQQPRPLHVEAEAGLAVDLGRAVEARQGAADEPVAGRILERDLRRHRQFGRLGRQLAVGEPPPVGMVDGAVLGAAGGGIDLPPGGGGRHQHRPRRGAGLGQALPLAAHAGAPSRHHAAEHGMGIFRRHRRLLDFDLFPGAVEFFGDDGRQGGIDPLTHLRLVADDGDAAVAADAQKGVGGEGNCGVGRDGAGKRQVAGEQQAATDQGALF